VRGGVHVVVKLISFAFPLEQMGSQLVAIGIDVRCHLIVRDDVRSVRKGLLGCSEEWAKGVCDGIDG
jgi:hypothetical protein